MSQLIVIDTQQHFEIEIPDDVIPEDYLLTEECRQRCADKILDLTTDLNIDRVLTKYDPKTEQWED